MTDIAFLLVGASGGGAERAMIGVANELARSGLRVDMVLVRKEGPFLSEIDPLIRVVDLGAGKVKRMLMPLHRYMKAEQPKLLVSALVATDGYVLLGKALFRWKSKIHISVQNSPSASAGVSNDIYARYWPQIIRWLYPFADSLNGISIGVSDDVERMMKKPKGYVPVINNPVDIPRAAERAAEAPAHPWLRDKAMPVLLAVGRLVKQKDVPTLLRAHAKLAATRPVRLLILGEGEDRAELEALVAELGTGDRVAMPGFDTNPFAAMAAADVFVLSSRWEGFANVVAEALACGTKVVSTDCPSGPAEILEDGRYGRLVPIGDVEALAAALGAALDTEVDRTALRTRANDFALEGVARAYRRLFDERKLLA